MNFKEFEIKDFKGIATSNRLPQKNEASECKNFDIREISGDLITRGGYKQKYAAPEDSRGKLSSVTTLAFENFYIPNAGDGDEVTCLVQKGAVAGETGVTLNLPPSRTIPIIWIRKWWNGSWQDSWQWLNRIVITRVRAVDGYKIQLDMADTSVISSNLFSGWTVYNLTKGYSAKVIKTYDYGSNTVGIKITRNRHDWENNDIVYLMKNYIPLTYFLGNYSADFKDICFHQVNNELRIGFGGYENRLALSISYVKRKWKLSGFDFGSGDTDLDPTVFDMDEIVLDPYIPVDNSALLDIIPSVGTLPAGTYNFKTISCLDNYEYIQIGESTYTTEASYDLLLAPAIDFATLHKRTTFLSLFYESSESYRWLQDFYLADNTDTKVFTIDEYGRVKFPHSSNENRYTQNTAIKAGSDANATTGWSIRYTNLLTLSSVTTAPEPKDGIYSIKFVTQETTEPYTGIRTACMSLSFLSPGKYTFNFWLQTDLSSTVEYGIGDQEGQTTERKAIDLAVADGWTEITAEFNITNTSTEFFVLNFRDGTNDPHYFAIDKLIISQGEYNPSLSGDTKADVELSAQIGYTPSVYVKSWDQAIVTGGKTFLINPYIDDRYENRIYYSLFSGDGASMYDVIDQTSFWVVENDGNDLIALVPLANRDFMVLKRNMTMIIDSAKGAIGEVRLGTGAVSRKSVINYGRKAAFCSENSVNESDGANFRDISDRGIRDQYRLLSTKPNIIAGREEKDNAYRFFTGDTTNKTEFIYTDRGWIKHVQNLYPVDYTTAKDGSLWFLRNGIVFDKSTGTADAGTAIPFSWKSVPIDISLIGEELTGNMRFYISALWIYFTQKSTMPFTMSVYLDGNSTAFHTITNAFTGAVTKRLQKQIKLGANCRSFQLEVSGSDTIGNQLSIHSLGCLWKPLPVGRYGNN
jgi:hypothetical protein